jgi:uracil-DNA glycosylase
MRLTILFVGENATSPVEPAEVLVGPSGRRLATMLNITLAQFARRYARRNLSSGTHWDEQESRSGAWQATRGCTRVVLLGSRVRRAFGFEAVSALDVATKDGKRFLMLPHPSGRNRWYNDARNTARAAAVLREFVEP